MSSRFGVRISDVTDWKQGAAARATDPMTPVACETHLLRFVWHILFCSRTAYLQKWATPTNPLALACFTSRSPPPPVTGPSLTLHTRRCSPTNWPWCGVLAVNDFALGEQRDQLVIGFTFVSWKTDFRFSVVINIAWHLSYFCPAAVTEVVPDSHTTMTQPETQPSQNWREFSMKYAPPVGLCGRFVSHRH